MTSTPEQPDSRPSFAHASEAELARILDFYEVRWRYEPDTFPIGWSLDGEVVESFSPDFYLPDLDMYLELTTLKQSLVRKKNRKLRRLRELYPDIRIKLFYARDFRMLLLKFGRLALAPELSGTVGQATPPRAQAEAADGDAPPAVVQLTGQLLADGDGAAVPDETSAGADGAVAPASQDRDELAPEPGAARTPRGRRRGRRRRAAAREAAVASAPPKAAGVTARAPGNVSSTGTLPA